MTSVAVKNPWIARYRKFIVVAATAIVEIANAWAGGPTWLYTVAAIASAVLVAMVGNAPMYRRPPVSKYVNP